MPKILVLNTSADVPKQFLALGPGLLPAWRQIWWAEPGDIIVSPVEIDREFIQYAAQVLGTDLTRLKILVAPEACEDDAALGSSEFLEGLSRTVESGIRYEVLAATTTASVNRLSSIFGESTAPNSLADEGVNELLNRKSYFRRLAAGIRSPIAEGAVVTERSNLAGAIDRLRKVTGSVVVKRDNAGGGYGNVIVTESTDVLPGAQRTVQYRDGEVGEIAHDLWSALTDAYSHCVVVEAYHTASHIFYFEFEIDEFGRAQFFDSGDVRSAKVDGASALKWLGLQLPASIPRSSGQVALTEAARLASHLGVLGYRGLVNVDGIVTPEGTVFINEFNCRWGGGTVLHVLAERLLGKGYGDDHMVRWVREAPYLPLAEAIARLKTASLDPFADADAGVTILAADPARVSALELFVRGRTPDELDRLEARALASVK